MTRERKSGFRSLGFMTAMTSIFGKFFQNDFTKSYSNSSRINGYSPRAGKVRRAKIRNKGIIPVDQRGPIILPKKGDPANCMNKTVRNRMRRERKRMLVCSG